MLRSIYLILAISFLPLILSEVHATHNRAGEITYEQIDDLTIRAVITTYTKASSRPADRDSLELFWGDGTSTVVPRSNGNGNGVVIGNDIKYNIYVAVHTYPSFGQYTMHMMDPNRIGGILNVNYPNSVSVPFYIETTFTLLNPQFQGYNNSAKLLQPPIDFGCVGKRFIHTPNAFDPDGDSLAYELIVPKQDIGTPVPVYNYPDQITPGTNNNISLDEVSGEFVWEYPQTFGEYNIAILIKEYRDGALINEIVRDMQILIRQCDNNPPNIETKDQLCVIAGDTINNSVVATDPDNPGGDQRIKLSATGGPFEVDHFPATFTASDDYQTDPATGFFKWNTSCEHINKRYYQVVFKAVDDFFFQMDGEELGLSTLKTVRIKVVGPAPEDVQSEASSEQAIISWAKPYICEETVNDYFKGFVVWRRQGSNQLPVDSCNVDLTNYGYEQIASNVTSVEDGRYYFTDQELERGKTYCYRITAEFAQKTQGNNPFNEVQSLPSEEICVQLNRDIPLITKVSVRETDPSDGSIRVEWLKPLAEDLDTLEHPGPYRYKVLRTNGITETGLEPVQGATFSSPTFSGLDDTSYTDLSINTSDQAYTYAIAFYTEGKTDEPYGISAPASSVFLTIESTDETNILRWELDVPWNNYSYDIFRFDGQKFDSITTVNNLPYEDTGLINGENYCYKIRSRGSYGLENIISPLLNYSQEACGVPIDTVAPCIPELELTNLCDQGGSIDPSESFDNTLNWNNPSNTCPNGDDVAGYEIYYSQTDSDPKELISTIQDPTVTEFVHTPETGLRGCYSIAAFDSTGNISEMSKQVCASICPEYELPNAFTPNGDDRNDLFVPRQNRFIARVDFKVYNQWGQLLYETTNPEINWDGTNQSGQQVAEGTYFYTCSVFEESSFGPRSQSSLLKGYIEIIR